MKSQIISSMTSFVLGTGVTLASLLAWTGAEDLQAIKDKFYDFESNAQTQIDSAVYEYSQVVVDANAEIGEYRLALQQANDNISQLITAYENKVDELENANTKYEEDLAELEYALSDMQVRLDQQYEADMNEIVEKANEQIGQANEDVENTKSDIENYVQNSTVSDGTYLQDKLNDVPHYLDTTGDKSVQDISSIVPSEQE